MSQLPPHPIKELPPVPKLARLIGPSFVILGMGLGSGEIILWPYLVSHWGLGIIWGIIVGITLQFFINMEVERYALIYGESIFVGFYRKFKWLPIWFIVSTFLGFGWPGIGLAGATLLQKLFSLDQIKIIATVVFISIGLILTLGRQLYQTVESLQKYLILFGVPFIFLLTIYLARPVHYQALLTGLAGVGPGYFLLPTGISIASFLGALAFAGAGGNLNLAQSFYVRDKGYGMGAHSDKIGSLITNPQSDKNLTLTGQTFALTKANLHLFQKWWKTINLEHLFIFWGIGLFTMLLLAFLSYITAYGGNFDKQDISFVIVQSQYIAKNTFTLLGPIFLLITGLMLSATQLTVLDSTSRIITENLLLLGSKFSARASRLYYSVLWIQIIFGLTVIWLGFTQPRQLITLGAVINAFTMFVYIFLILFLNNRQLPHPLRPGLLRNLVLSLGFLFFGYFCIKSLFA